MKHTGNKFCTSGWQLVLQCVQGSLSTNSSVSQSGLHSACLDATLCLSKALREVPNSVLVSASQLKGSINTAHPACEPCLYQHPVETSNLLLPQVPPNQMRFGPGSCSSPVHASSCTSCNSLLCRKPVWAKLKSTAYEGLTGNMYTPLPATAAQACLQSRSLGVAKLRLLPKKTGQSHAKPGTLTLSLYCLCPHMKHMHLTQHLYLDLVTHAI